MSILAHIDSLAEKRTHLKEQIAAESARPMPDLTLIKNLKKQNLVLKEEMQRYLILVNDKEYHATS